jgi:hypothetical protein
MKWRDHLAIHPAAALFPPMSDTELAELAADIKANGLRVKPTVFMTKEGKPLLLDARNRFDAMERKGLPTVDAGTGLPLCDYDTVREGEVDPYALVVSLNFTRRHLTAEQRNEVIRKLREERPDMSLRTLAKIAKTSPMTVYRVVSKSSEPAGVSSDTPAPAGTAKPSPPKPSRVIGGDGKSYPSKKLKPKAAAPATPATPKPAVGKAQGRAVAVIQFTALLHSDLRKTLEELVSILKDERPKIVEISKDQRIVIARGYLQALGLTDTDLQPIGLAVVH